MGTKVFANGMGVSSKTASGKSICAFPDVCFTPPLTPATPPGVPIPYPNTGMASDTTGGSKKVKIGGKEIGLKNKSSFKKSMGDEAGSAPKKGVVTSKNMGKVFFNSWSMDVKVEGKNVVRMLDLTTNNHGSMPGNTPPWPHLDTMAFDIPGQDDAALAKSEGNSPEQVAARKRLAKEFYKKEGMPEHKIDSHLDGIDFSKPVEVVDIPKGTKLQQIQAPGGAQGNYYSGPGAKPSELGISDQAISRESGKIVTKEAKTLETNTKVTALKSTAAGVEDTWSVPGEKISTEGGATQYFSMKKDAFS